MGNTKMTKDVVPQDFTLGLAIVDALPVLFAGAMKVVWKSIVEWSNLYAIAGLFYCRLFGNGSYECICSQTGFKRCKVKLD